MPISADAGIVRRIRLDDGTRDIEVFLTGSARVAPDQRHSHSEERFIAVGRNEEGRPMFVAFTIRMKNGQRLVRPISARYMHEKEIEGYETESS
jgi:uncharacterized protein